ncbi:unnamed protein product [Polarella glacialis]|uniref:Uncharacterized protein n=1 Tax=Polarella glacialis TaxID=89957 RepID=A0A813GQY7_POLGL|nr:unnamed protein product [Polarella glacialis]
MDRLAALCLSLTLKVVVFDDQRRQDPSDDTNLSSELQATAEGETVFLLIRGKGKGVGKGAGGARSEGGGRVSVASSRGGAEAPSGGRDLLPQGRADDRLDDEPPPGAAEKPPVASPGSSLIPWYQPPSALEGTERTSAEQQYWFWFSVSLGQRLEAQLRARDLKPCIFDEANDLSDVLATCVCHLGLQLAEREEAHLKHLLQDQAPRDVISKIIALKSSAA